MPAPKTPEASTAPTEYTTADGRVLPLKTSYEYDETGALVRPAAYVLTDGTIRVEA